MTTPHEKKGKQDYPSLFFSFKVEYRLFQREKKSALCFKGQIYVFHPCSVFGLLV